MTHANNVERIVRRTHHPSKCRQPPNDKHLHFLQPSPCSGAAHARGRTTSPPSRPLPSVAGRRARGQKLSATNSRQLILRAPQSVAGTERAAQRRANPTRVARPAAPRVSARTTASCKPLKGEVRAKVCVVMTSLSMPTSRLYCNCRCCRAFHRRLLNALLQTAIPPAPSVRSRRWAECVE